MASQLPKGHDKFVFPQPLPEKGQGEQRSPSFRGLTLLDQLAIAALPVAQERTRTQENSVSRGGLVIIDAQVAEVTREAYDLAEAMLVERAKRLSKKGGDA